MTSWSKENPIRRAVRNEVNAHNSHEPLADRGEDVLPEPGDDMLSARRPIMSGNAKAGRRRRSLEHWLRAMAKIDGSSDELLDEQEKIMADLPAILTKDARGLNPPRP
jgi:hypothetical protein